MGNTIKKVVKNLGALIRAAKPKGIFGVGSFKEGLVLVARLIIKQIVPVNNMIKKSKTLRHLQGNIDQAKEVLEEIDRESEAAKRNLSGTQSQALAQAMSKKLATLGPSFWQQYIAKASDVVNPFLSGDIGGGDAAGYAHGYIQYMTAYASAGQESIVALSSLC